MSRAEMVAAVLVAIVVTAGSTAFLMSLILPKQTVTVTMSVPLAEIIWSTTTQTITMEAHIHVVNTLTVWVHVLEDTAFTVFPNQTVTITPGGGRD